MTGVERCTQDEDRDAAEQFARDADTEEAFVRQDIARALCGIAAEQWREDAEIDRDDRGERDQKGNACGLCGASAVTRQWRWSPWSPPFTRLAAVERNPRLAASTRAW